VGTHRRGPLPQRRYPAPVARPAAAVTHPGDHACKSGRAVLPRRAWFRRESSLSRALRPAASASLRSAPGRPLTGSFPGKIRHLSGGQEGAAAYHPVMSQEASNLFTRLAPVLNVRDLAAERAFYEKLGLPVIYEGPEYPRFHRFRN
jgi:hypothetical protein